MAPVDPIWPAISLTKVRGGAREDGAGGVEFLDQRRECAFAGPTVEAEEADAEDDGAGIGQDDGVGGEQGAEQLAGVGLLPRRAEQRGHHADLGAVGEHAHDVEEQVLSQPGFRCACSRTGTGSCPTTRSSGPAGTRTSPCR